MANNIYNIKAHIDRFIYVKPHDTYEEERIDQILGMIPADVETVLDIGTGAGHIYRKLKGRNGLRPFGMDISLELVGRLNENTISVADIKKIPFKDGSFDLVLTADVIEHINPNDFDESINEIIRVSKKYILINSPYKDTVDWPVARCGKCGREFNIYGHMRSIDKGLIRKLFPAAYFDVLRMAMAGRLRDARPLPLVRMARRFGKVYSAEATICPYCFNGSIVHPNRNAAERCFGSVICALFLIMDKITPPAFKDKSEICVLLKKR